MTATMTAPSLEQLAPNVAPRVRGDDLKTAQMALLGIGVVVLGASCALGMGSAEHKRFYFSWLTAYMAVLGICLGGLFFIMLQHATRAGWSVGVRRLAENMLTALPVMLLLFVPILVGFRDLFGVWADAVTDEKLPGYDAVLAGKTSFLNPTFFYVRLGCYFAAWIGLAAFFRRGSMQQDLTGDPATTLKMARVAAPGLLLFAVTISLAAIDWMMSLDPHWFSTIFGVCYFGGSTMAFLAFAILMAKGIGRSGYLREAINVEHYHDLGKLMFAFMLFWTYVNFSQYMLIWYANLPEETAFYRHRKEGGWSAVGTLLVFGHFFVPFAFLLSRHVKRNGLTLGIGAVFLLAIHLIDMQYLILPNAAHGHGTPGTEAAHGGAHAAALTEGGNALFGHFGHNLGVWLQGLTIHDLLCYVGMLSLVAGVTLQQVRKNNLVPLRDPRLRDSLQFQNF